MSDDIVTRLRIDKPTGKLCNEAAREIERLQSIIGEVHAYIHRNCFYGPNADGDEFNNDAILDMDVWFRNLLREKAVNGD